MAPTQGLKRLAAFLVLLLAGPAFGLPSPITTTKTVAQPIPGANGANVIAPERREASLDADATVNGTAGLHKRVCPIAPLANTADSGKEVKKGRFLEYMMWGSVEEADNYMHDEIVPAYNRGQPSQRNSILWTQWHKRLARHWNLERAVGGWKTDLDSPALQTFLSGLPNPDREDGMTLGESYPTQPPGAQNGGPLVSLIVKGSDDLLCGAWFVNAFNIRDGIIIVQAANGPRLMLSTQHMTDPSKPQLTDVEIEERLEPVYGFGQWSDVMFGQWMFLHRKGASQDPWQGVRYSEQALRQKVPDLNYFVVKSISGPDKTVGLIMRALQLHHSTLHNGPWTNEIPAWPGVSFQTGESDFSMILGTPIGQGIAWMLARHKDQFGERMVQSVTVFSLQTGPGVSQFPSLLFHVVPKTDELVEQAKAREKAGFATSYTPPADTGNSPGAQDEHPTGPGNKGKQREGH